MSLDAAKEFFSCLALRHTPGLGPRSWKSVLSAYESAYEAVADARNWPARKVLPKNQIMQGFRIMLAVSVLNIAANALFAPHALWSRWPVTVFAFGWALMVPVVTLLVLDLHPDRRGMASSLQAVVGSTANGIVAGAVAPLVMHSALGLAVMSAAFMLVGLVAWLWLRRRWPGIGG